MNEIVQHTNGTESVIRPCICYAVDFAELIEYGEVEAFGCITKHLAAVRDEVAGIRARVEQAKRAAEAIPPPSPFAYAHPESAA